MNTVRVYFLLSICLGFLFGCGSPVEFGIGASIKIFKQSHDSFSNQIDVLWVIDNSGSMAPIQAKLVNNFDSFINNFVSKKYDFHLSVTTTEAYKARPNFLNNPELAKFKDYMPGGPVTGVPIILPTTPDLESTFVINATQGVNGSGDERAFSSMRESLDSSFNSGFLRPQSFLAVIILSDEDDFSNDSRAEFIDDHNYANSGLDTVDSYVSYLDQLTKSTGAFRRYNVSSIAVTDQNCYDKHILETGATIIGQRYIDISHKTDGVIASICDDNYSNSLIAIQNKIAELSTQFYLDKTPKIDSISVRVNGNLVPPGALQGWTYNAVANSIVFHGEAIPNQDAEVTVIFQPNSINL